MFIKRPNASAMLLLSLLSFLAGCRKEAEPTNPGATVVLVDRTLSMRGNKIPGFSEHFNEHVVPSLHPGERVMVESITDQATLADPPMKVIDEELPTVVAPPANYFGEDFKTHRKKCFAQVDEEYPMFERAVQGIHDRAAAIFVPQALAQKSFILDGVESAASYFANTAGPKLLVLYTDGLEDSEEYSVTLKFDSPDFWRQTSVKDILSGLKQQGRIPNLSGTHVYLIGLATQRPELKRQVQIFWTEYFKATGVSVRNLHVDAGAPWQEPARGVDLKLTLCPAE